MKYTRYILAIVLLAFALQARADWLQNQINNLIQQVQDVWNTVTGDVKDTAADKHDELGQI